MIEIQVKPNEAGQRFDKFLLKYLKEAPSSFVFKMLRKKNITLNKKKADGKEKLETGDLVQLFLADDTIAKFRGSVKKVSYPEPNHIHVVYEDEDILILNKPVGILTQKADEKDISLNEELIGYLLETKAITEEDLATFKPSVCNRLDRNTSGLVLCGKSLEGLQFLSEIIRNRSLRKYYVCVVVGQVKEAAHLQGYLLKDDVSNQVTIYREKREDASYIKTDYRPLRGNGQYTELEVELITGKTHQIRAHLASIGHPIVGDRKYGLLAQEGIDRKHLKYQALSAVRLVFPKTDGKFAYLSNKEFCIEDPYYFDWFFED